MQSLKLGESDSALAAGVNLMLLGETTAAICQLQALSPVGRCKTFDASADGYGRGEGVAVVLLQPTDQAAGSLAILLGSAVNQVQNFSHKKQSCPWEAVGLASVLATRFPALSQLSLPWMKVEDAFLQILSRSLASTP